MSATFCHELIPNTNATPAVSVPVAPVAATMAEVPLRPRLRPVRSPAKPEFKERMVLPLLTMTALGAAPAPRHAEAATLDHPEPPLVQQAA